MRGYRIEDRAGHLHLSLHEDLPMPQAGPGQLLVRVNAAGLNRGEFIAGHGLHSPHGGAKPVGGEASGVVVACGPGAAHDAASSGTAPEVPTTAIPRAWRVGDAVFGRCAGAFAEYTLMDVREAMPMPPSLDWAQAASVPLTFMVGYDMLVQQGRLRSGDWLLVAGVASGVGVSALLAAKAMGARVIGTSGSPAKLERLKALGLDVGVATRGPDFTPAVLEATQGHGVQLALNTVGGSVFGACVQSLAFEGRLAMVGYVDGQLSAPLDLQALHAKRLSLFGVSNKLRTAAQKAQTAAGFQADWGPLLADGRLRPVVDGVWPFEELEAARAAMQADRHVGKLVLLGSQEAS